MEYYDLYVSYSDMEGKIELAKKLGLKGLGLAISTQEEPKIPEFLKKLRSARGEIDLVSVLLVEASTPKEMKNLVSKYRELFEVIMVSGGDYAINRAAVEDSRVDVLVHPEFRRSDSGVDHVLAKLASENDVAIGISIHSIFTTYGKVRSLILSHHRENLMLCDKFKAKVVLVSGAWDKWDMRGMREMASLANILDYPIGKSVEAVTEAPFEMVKNNRKKLSGKVITDGVEIVG